MNKIQKDSDLDTFYNLIAELEERTGGKKVVSECTEIDCPPYGICFFFGPDENRNIDKTTPRIVYVGTHSKQNSQRILWKRFKDHKGTSDGRSQRNSSFRKSCGRALMKRDPTLKVATWGSYKSPKSKKDASLEMKLEGRVTDYIGAMKILFLPVPSLSGVENYRTYITENSIALLSNYLNPTDKPGNKWLGHYGSERIQKSGLWNVNHTSKEYDHDFLKLFEQILKKPSPFLNKYTQSPILRKNNSEKNSRGKGSLKPSKGISGGFGETTRTTQDGPHKLYLAEFPASPNLLTDNPIKSGYGVFKIGISNNALRRLGELNQYFPETASIGWEIIRTTEFVNKEKAMEAEYMFKKLATEKYNGTSLGGEFFVLNIKKAENLFTYLATTSTISYTEDI